MFFINLQWRTDFFLQENSNYNHSINSSWLTYARRHSFPIWPFKGKYWIPKKAKPNILLRFSHSKRQSKTCVTQNNKIELSSTWWKSCSTGINWVTSFAPLFGLIWVAYNLLISFLEIQLFGFCEWDHM